MAISENNGDLTQTGDSNETLDDWLRRFDDKSTTSTITNLSMPDSTSNTESSTETNTENIAPPPPEAIKITPPRRVTRDGSISIVTTPAGDKIYLNFAATRTDMNTFVISDKVRTRGEHIFSDMVHSTNSHQAYLSKELATQFTEANPMSIVRTMKSGLRVLDRNTLSTDNAYFEVRATGILGTDGNPFHVSLVNGMRHEMFHLIDPDVPNFYPAMLALSEAQKAALEAHAMAQTNKFRKEEGMVERARYTAMSSTELSSWQKQNPGETPLRNLSRIENKISVLTNDSGERFYLHFNAISNTARVNLEKLIAQIGQVTNFLPMMNELYKKFGTIENPLNFSYDPGDIDDFNVKGLRINELTNTVLIAHQDLGTMRPYLGTDYKNHEFRPIDALLHQLVLFTNPPSEGSDSDPHEIATILTNNFRNNFGVMNRWGWSYKELVWEGGIAENEYAQRRKFNVGNWTEYRDVTYDDRHSQVFTRPEQIIQSNLYLDSVVQEWTASPLVLSLDNDFIDVRVSGFQMLFDYNGDGNKYSTEWIGPGDGYLVYDRDNNDEIDNGTEMFIGHTLKSNGDVAVNGFDALSDLDSDHNGLFDANDILFDKLEIWQDRNSNGYSDYGELLSLDDAGIESISTQWQPDHNYGAYAQVMMSSGDKKSAYSLELESNSVYREFADKIDIPEELQDLPDVKGSGKTLRDLREAATLSPELATLLQQFSDATTREEQLAQLDGLIQAWVDTADYVQLTDRIAEVVVSAGPDIPIRNNSGKIIGYEPNDTPSDHTLKFRISDLNGGYLSADQLRVGNFVDRPEQDEFSRFVYNPDVEALAKAQVLEVFNDYSFFKFDSYLQDFGSHTWTGWLNGVYGTYHGGGGPDGYLDARVMVWVEGKSSASQVYGTEDGLPDEIFLDERHLTFSPERAEKIHEAYDLLKETIYESLVTQTRLSELTDSIEVSEGDNGNEVDFTALKTLIDEKISSDAVNGTADVINYNKMMASSLVHHGFNGWEQLVNALATTTITAELQQMLDDKVDLVTDSATFDEDGYKVVLGNEVDNVIYDQGNRTYIYGGGGRDTLRSNNNHSGVTLDGGAGNDTIYTYSSNATLIGGADEDTLEVLGYAKNVTLNGGTGTDTLIGGDKNDTYIFKLGDGFDTVIETEDVGPGDTVYFGAGIAGIGEDMTVSRDGYDLLLTHDNGTDQVRITDWYKFESVDGRNVIETIEFADGKIWQASIITELGLTLNGSDGEDTLEGIGVKTIYQGRGQEDIQWGGNYANKLNGGGGKDTLTGGSYSEGDILDGGADIDELHAGSESTFTTLFGGGGDDTLSALYAEDHTTLIGGIGNDTLEGNSLSDTYLFSYGDGFDTIYESTEYEYEESVDKLIFDENIYAKDITVSRDNIDLKLTHNNGIDQITVKKWFNRGAGSYKLEQIEFDDGKVWHAQDLTTQLMIQNGGDGVDTLTGMDKGYVDEIYTREYYRSYNLVYDANILNGGGGNDILTGGLGSSNDILTGGDGEDTLVAAAYSHNNILDGGDKNDVLEVHRYAGGTILRGGAGEDTLTADRDSYNNTFKGGTGNDTIIGSESADTYIYNLGDGHDTIYDYGGSDVLQFGVGLSKDRLLITQDLNSSDDLLLQFLDEQGNATNDRITIEDAISGYSESNHYIEQLLFANDDDITGEEAAALGHIYYGDDSKDDSFRGSSGDDTIYGYGGKDNFYTNGGEDSYYGGKDNDSYMFYLSGAATTIYEYVGEGSDDVIYLNSGYYTHNTNFSRNGTDLVVTVTGAETQITVAGWYLENKYEIESFKFVNEGSEYNVAYILSMTASDSNYALRINNAITDHTIDEDTFFSFQVPVDTFVDEAGGTLSYNATLADGSALPSWLSFNTATQSFSGTPANDDVANLEVKVTATNGNAATVSDVFSLSVNNINDAPIINNAMSDIATDEDAAFRFQIPTTTFIDVDTGDTLTYSATLVDGSELPDWLSFDDVTQTFSGTPTNDDVANLELKVTATDDSGESISDVFSLNVNNVNDAPIINFDDFQAELDLIFSEQSPYQRIAQGEYFEYTLPQGMIVDPDVGDSLSYEASFIDGSALPAWLNFDAATQTLSGIPNHDYVNQGFPITITATDNNGASTDVQLGFLVLNSNDAPVVINPIADQVLSAGESFTLEPDSVFADVDLEHLFVHDPADLENRQWETLNYSVTLSDGSALPPWISVESVDEKLVFSGRATGTVGVTVTATDNAGLTVSDTFMLTTESSDGTAGGPPPPTINDNYTLNYEANTALVTSTRWYDSTIVSGFNFDLSGQALDENPVTDYSGIDSAFNFSGYGGGDMESLSDLSGNPTNNSASFELWFRSHDLYEDEVLFETGGYGFLGGGNGTSLVMMDDDNDGWSDDLQFVVKNGSTKRTLTVDLSTFLFGARSVTEEFVQVVGTYDRNIGGSTIDEVTLYVNGIEVDYADATGLNDWASTDDTGLGQVNGSINIGNSNVSNFEGDIAKFRFYEHALSAADVSANFSAVAMRDTDITKLGTDADETVTGATGHDVISGGKGNDTLQGFAGNDNYLYTRGDGQDTIIDNLGDDEVNFSDINHDALWFAQNGNDLDITVVGTDDTLTIQDWYSNANARIESFSTTEDSAVLLENQVDQLVSAMAAYNVPSGAGNVIPQDTKDALQPVLASSWS